MTTSRQKILKIDSVTDSNPMTQGRNSGNFIKQPAPKAPTNPSRLTRQGCSPCSPSTKIRTWRNLRIGTYRKNEINRTHSTSINIGWCHAEDQASRVLCEPYGHGESEKWRAKFAPISTLLGLAPHKNNEQLHMSEPICVRTIGYSHRQPAASC